MNQQETELSQGDAALRLKRGERLREYLESCLDDPDPLQANIGAAASEMSDVASRLKQLLDEVLSEPTDALHRLDKYSSVFDMYLRCTRQAERYMQLDKRLADVGATTGKRRPR